MKLNAIAIVAAALFCGSCYNMDGVHEEYFELSNQTYIGKPTFLGVVPGYEKAQISWSINEDPRIQKTEVYWDNGITDSLIVIDFLNPDSDIYLVDSLITVERVDNELVYTYQIEGIQEGEYTIFLRTAGEDDTKSLSSEYPLSVYGEVRVAALTARPVASAVVDDYGSVQITWGSADYCDGVRITYLTNDDEWITIDEESASATTALANAKQYTDYSYVTYYLPDDGLDRVETNSEFSRVLPFKDYELSTTYFTCPITVYTAVDTYQEGVYFGEAPISGSTYTRETLWNALKMSSESDTGTGVDGYLSTEGASYMRTVTIDLGEEYLLTDFTLWQRRYGTFFTSTNVRVFSLYGASNDAAVDVAATKSAIKDEYLAVTYLEVIEDELDPDTGLEVVSMYEIPDLSNWTPLLNSVSVPIDSGEDEPTDADQLYALENGYTFTITTVANSPMRFLRIQWQENFDGATQEAAFEAAEIDIYGSSIQRTDTLEDGSLDYSRDGAFVIVGEM